MATDGEIIELHPRKPLTEAQRAQRRAAAQAAKLKNNKPASGIPAGGEGHGEKRGQAPSFSAAYQPGKSARDYDRAELADIMRDRLLHLAMNAKGERTQLAATAEMLDRLEGKSIARTITDRQAIAAPGVVKAVFPKAVNGRD